MNSIKNSNLAGHRGEFSPWILKANLPQFHKIGNIFAANVHAPYWVSLLAGAVSPFAVPGIKYPYKI